MTQVNETAIRNIYVTDFKNHTLVLSLVINVTLSFPKIKGTTINYNKQKSYL